jgi:site-specific DNA-methyltransferase (adenine-specific)
VSVATYIVGDVRRVLATLDPGSQDLCMTSPPFLLLREYLPMDHPWKNLEIGREATPAEFIDMLLALTADIARVLAPHGSIAIELGDTHSGSGGAGGDYAEGGLRDGQPAYAGTAAAERNAAYRPGGGFRPNLAEGQGQYSAKKRNPNPPATWPLGKSLTLVPELYRVALAYGINPLTGAESPAGRWIVRNVVRWVRVNPPVGSDGDKFRRAVSDIVVACRYPKRYFDGTAVRVSREGSEFGTAPLLDWWLIPSVAYEGAHYAVYPEALVEPVVKALCPQRVCTVCGKPSERIIEKVYEAFGDAERQNAEPRVQAKPAGVNPSAQGMRLGRAEVEHKTVGWTDCVHGSWRRGRVLDPFAGSGTTGQVATGLGRDATLIDLDDRNVLLAEQRIGMFGEYWTHLDVPIPGTTTPVRLPR